MLKIGTVFFLALLQSACSPKAGFDSQRWDGNGPLPPAPAGVSDGHVLEVGKLQLQFETQKIEGVEVAGTYYKKITREGSAEFQDYRWMSKVPLSIRRDLLLMRAQRSFVLKSFQKQHPDLALSRLIDGPDLYLEMDEAPQVFWKLVFEEPDGSLQAYFVNRTFKLVRQQRLGSNMIDATANIYPMGPLKSEMQKIIFKNLLDVQTLATSSVSISSESGQLAIPSAQNELNFNVDDARFFQVQTLYYITEAIHWFEQKLKFKLPFVLEAETQKGFPDKTNTAFYFQRKIRLGDGDGDAFDRIPMDPSIVTHETNHALIDAVAGLPFEGEGGSINEAFADFFAASLLNNPKMGEVAYKKAPYKRTLDNTLKLSEKSGGLYHDSGIVSGLLWSIASAVGAEEGRNFAWQTLLRLNPGSDFNTLKLELDSVIAKESPENQKKIKTILEDRGWL